MWLAFILTVFALFLILELGALALRGPSATLTAYVRQSTAHQPIMILFIGIALGVLALHFWGGASQWCGP